VSHRWTPWREAALAAVDVETTGLDPQADQVISFAAVPIDGGRIEAGGAVYGLVRPGRSVPATSIEVHGIRPQDLIEAPPPETAFDALADAVRGRDLITHASWVERAFLGTPLRRYGIRLPKTLLDTAVMWRLLTIEREHRDPGLRQLGAIAEALGLPVHDPHHALGDALTTAQVFLALATHLEQSGRRTVGSLRGAARAVEGFRWLNPEASR
jgi:DNA polymerase III subunit epsilon